MIKDVFLPTRLGSYYVFEQKILSIDIYDNLVCAALIICKGETRIVEYTEYILLQENSFSQLQQAVKKILGNAGSYDQLITSLPSSLVLYKTLTLPFLEYEKIKMVVPYEIEPHLPFRLDQAAFDFIIMHQDKEKKTSTILVGATQLSHIEAVVQQFEKLKLLIHTITAIPFGVYGLYQHSAALHKALGTFVIDFGWNSIQLIYITVQGIEFIRTISFGVSSVFFKTADQTAIPLQELYDLVLQQGQDDKLIHDGYKEIIKEIQTSWWAIEKQYGKEHMPTNFVCSGVGIALPSLLQTVQSAFAVQVQTIESKDIIEAYKIQQSKKVKDRFACQEVILNTLSYSKDYQTNLLTVAQQSKEKTLLNQQIIVAIIASLILLAGVYWITRKETQLWQAAIVTSKKQLVREVERQMNLDIRGEHTNKVLEKAEEFLSKEKRLWFSFSKESEQSLLEYLQALSTTIDRDSLGLVINRMKIDFDEITIQGSVKDFEALQIFEEELMELSNFDIVQKPRELSFVVKLKAKSKGDR